MYYNEHRSVNSCSVSQPTTGMNPRFRVKHRELGLIGEVGKPECSGLVLVGRLIMLSPSRPLSPSDE